MEPKIHLHVLASGSKGNAAVVEGPAGSVLIDCGLSLRELRRRADELGANVDDLEAVLVTLVIGRPPRSPCARPDRRRGT